ncbi:hypothetical protein T08_15680 [Trichinella sp. T8]|nr:hypothetical protein T08_15680 [Trichinella sp. T8]
MPDGVSSQYRPHCNDPQGGAGGSASGSASVRPPSLCDCSSSLAQSRLLVDILRTHLHTYHLSPHRSPLSLRKDRRFS